MSSTLDSETSCCSRYKIAMDEEVSKGRMNLVENQLDALIYFYPDGMNVCIYHHCILCNENKYTRA